MPLYPQGGGLYPDSIDNSLLADMAEATVKGRPMGGGSGNPIDLTGAQLQAILAAASGAAVYTNCRLAYVSTTQIRLDRHNGCLLTIDNVPQVIPAAGVTYSGPATGGIGTVGYVYAYMNAGVMALELSATGYSADSRNGMQVKNGDPSRTLVAMYYVNFGNAFVFTTGIRGMCNYYNQFTNTDIYSIPGSSTSSGAQTPICPQQYAMAFWNSPGGRVEFVGYVQGSAAGWINTQLSHQPLGSGATGSSANVAVYQNGGGQGGNASNGANWIGNGFTGFYLGGSVGAGTGTWTGFLHLTHPW